MAHATQPKICEQCIHELDESLSNGSETEHWYCSHNQTLALIGIKQQKVVYWSLYGQVPPEEALMLLSKSKDLGSLLFGDNLSEHLH